MLILKILSDLICGALNAWGGYSWHNARRFIMPCVIAVSVSIISHTWWLGALCLPVMGTLCLGYFPLGKIGRGLWLCLQSVVIGLGLLLTGHLAWYIYVPYCIVAGILGGTLVNLYQPIGDAIFGVWLGSIVWFIK